MENPTLLDDEVFERRERLAGELQECREEIFAFLAPLILGRMEAAYANRRRGITDAALSDLLHELDDSRITLQDMIEAANWLAERGLAKVGMYHGDFDMGKLWTLVSGEDLLKSWESMMRSFPRDGSIGAAKAIADHGRKVHEVEKQLDVVHPTWRDRELPFRPRTSQPAVTA